MKKKLLYTLALSSVIGIGTMDAQLFIRDYNVSPTSVNQDKPVDVNHYKDAVNDAYFSLHYSRRGNMPVMRYDANTHAPLLSASLASVPAVAYDPQAIQHLGTGTAVLFNVPSLNPSYAIETYDHTTNGAVNGINISYPSRDFGIVTRDMMIDPTTRFLYVVGDITNNVTGRVGIYVAQVDFGLTTVVDHIYMNDQYDLHSNNIFVFNRDEIYVGAGASNPNDPLDRGAFVMEINAGLVPVAQTIIHYTDECIRNQMTTACAKRYKDDVYVLCPSYLDADQNRGDYFLAQMDPALTTINNQGVYYPKDFYFDKNVAPKFEFVNDFQNILVSGISSPAVSDLPGYVHSFYDMTTNFVGRKVYPNTNVDVDGNPIIDAYNENTKQIFSVAEDFGNAPFYYALNCKPDGYISDECNKDLDQQRDCRIYRKDIDIPNERLDHKVVRLILRVTTVRPDYRLYCGEDGAVSDKSLAATEDKGTWSVYPNPAATNVEIACTSTINTIVITNIKGEKVRTFTNVNSLHMAIEINDLPKGMYFINAISSDNQTINKKFIKE